MQPKGYLDALKKRTKYKKKQKKLREKEMTEYMSGLDNMMTGKLNEEIIQNSNEYPPTDDYFFGFNKTLCKYSSIHKSKYIISKLGDQL